MLMVLIVLWRWLIALWLRLVEQRRYSRRVASPPCVVPPMKHRCARKPPWVRDELIRLRAWSPDLSSRKLADIFNRGFAHRGMSVCKLHVAKVLRQAMAEILQVRHDGKHRVPRPMPINRVWAMDLTGKADLTGKQHMMLGLLDHGSRACLALTALPDKRSITILRELIVACRRFGMPRCLRVDNEACFNSRLMKAALTLLGIRLQTTDLHCPWQNGRIERFFGTFKRALDRIVVTNADDLRIKLVEFRAWYNHARPHQHLDFPTPTEVWDGRAKATRHPRFISVWGGFLNGWLFAP
jgi:putative transposase